MVGSHRWRSVAIAGLLLTGSTTTAARIDAPDNDRLPTVALSAEDLDRLWQDLSDADAANAYRAIITLASGSKQAVPFLGQHLKPAPTADATKIARLIVDLDSDRFKEREQAARELERLGEMAQGALRKAMAGSPSAELRQGAKALLEKLDLLRNPERLREVRAVEALDYAGTPAAREVLQRLAGGAPQAQLTQDAKASLERLAKRAAERP